MGSPWLVAMPVILYVALSIIPIQAALTRNCCSALTKALEDKVSYPNSIAYNASVQSYWSKQERDVSPSCIVLPEVTEDVSTTVKVLTAAHLRCKFAIRGGGHTAQAGSANIERGVTIDMSALKDITLSADHKSVTVGSGQRWANVYGLLEPLGLAVTGGRAAEVGVGGLLLGGGISYFATREGFSCDNVVSYEVVLANGSVVTATSALHSDLWLALKGGSNNFGIVTRFVMRTFDQGPIFAGDLYYPTSTIKEQAESFSNFISNPNYDENAGWLHNWGFSDTQSAIIVNTIFYSKPDLNPPPFQSLRAIQPQLGNTLSLTSLTPYSKVLGGLSPSSLQELTFSATFHNDVTMIQDMFDLWNASTADVASVLGVKWSLSLQPINNAITSKSFAAGGNSLGLLREFPNGALVLVSLSATWNNADDNARMAAAANILLHAIISTSKAGGTFDPYLDLNHANTGQDPIAGYGPIVQAQLYAVSKRYDPNGIFQESVPGGFKL